MRHRGVRIPVPPSTSRRQRGRKPRSQNFTWWTFQRFCREDSSRRSKFEVFELRESIARAPACSGAGSDSWFAPCHHRSQRHGQFSSSKPSKARARAQVERSAEHLLLVRQEADRDQSARAHPRPLRTQMHSTRQLTRYHVRGPRGTKLRVASNTRRHVHRGRG